MWSVVQDYCLNSNIHGLRFILDRRYSLIERFFWFVCVVLAWFGVYYLIIMSWGAFINNPIALVVKTDNLIENTDFPSIQICETEYENQVQAQNFLLKYYNIEDDYDMEDVIMVIAYMNDGNIQALIDFCARNARCVSGNYSDIADKVRSSCEELITACAWNDEPFDCCTYFRPIRSVKGACFAINSIQTNGYVKLDMKSNTTSGPGSVHLRIDKSALIYTYGPEEVVTYQDKSFLVHHKAVMHERSITVQGTENDLLVRDVDIKTRGCRFPDENYLTQYKYYSYTACAVECIKDKQLQMCNCTIHHMPIMPEDKKCDFVGLMCLKDNVLMTPVEMKEWHGNKEGIVCDCVPSCTELNLNILRDYQHKPEPNDNYTLTLSLEKIPQQAYLRSVVRGKLDLVVSIGGTAGLFIGASLLSFVELVYFFFIRVGGNYYIRARERNQQ